MRAVTKKREGGSSQTFEKKSAAKPLKKKPSTIPEFWPFALVDLFFDLAFGIPELLVGQMPTKHCVCVAYS